MTGKIKRKKSLFKRLHENKKFLAAESIFLPVLLGLVIYLLWQFQILHKILNTNICSSTPESNWSYYRRELEQDCS